MITVRSEKKTIRIKENTKILMECLECGTKFAKKISRYTFEVKCPRCGSYDTDIR